MDDATLRARVREAFELPPSPERTDRLKALRAQATQAQWDGLVTEWQDMMIAVAGLDE